MNNKQKRALEKITGKAWDVWHPDAVRAYFLFTDRGQKIVVKAEAMDDFNELMSQHHWHSVIVGMWKEDFRAGLLFLSDFLGQDFPKAYIKHAVELYYSAFRYIPKCYRQAIMELEKE